MFVFEYNEVIKNKKVKIVSVLFILFYTINIYSQQRDTLIYTGIPWGVPPQWLLAGMISIGANFGNNSESFTWKHI
ncbi:hypothetical protein HMPREF9071_1770 [Capnocytophaga sp. oral taxon 338 str. F0234]|jgi:hypothetical protein|nr:hypothetical protein HMPREF9071_1770 [Capnocytophaga sp. oral taxon 338 str. F0234]